MRYLGSKESLTPSIRQLLDEHGLLRRDLVFCDAFCGMGSVADAVKDVYDKIVVNDALLCALTFTLGKQYANECTFAHLGFSPFDYFNNNTERIEGFFYENYSTGGSDRMYFTPENAGRIDYFRSQIETWKEKGEINQHEYCYLLACLLESVSDVANTAGVYGAFLKHWDKRALKPIVFGRIDVNHGLANEVIAYRDKIENVIQDIDCDILYLDPPYTQNQYGTQYHLLETLILNDEPSISPITGSRSTAPMRSDWSKMYHCHILFDKIIAKTRARYIIFSYNNDGFMSQDFIESTLRRYGIEDTYSCTILDYKKYNNVKCQGAEGHCEYLFFIEKKRPEDVVVESPLNYTGSKSKMMDLIKCHMQDVRFDKFIDVFGGGFNVGINISCDNVIYNDINPFVEGLIQSFDTNTLDYLNYIKRIIAKYSLSPDNKEGYLKLRNKYNSLPPAKRDPRMLYSLVLYGFQQQLRFNTSLEFNNPSGSRWFNECLLSKFITFARCIKEKEVTFKNESFEKLLPDVTETTFVYADPPYRSTLGVYNDGKRGFEGWTINHENRLFDFLNSVNDRNAKFMLSYVLEVDDFYNDNLANWVERMNYRLIEVERPQGRYNNRKEILITNY